MGWSKNTGKRPTYASNSKTVHFCDWTINPQSSKCPSESSEQHPSAKFEGNYLGPLATWKLRSNLKNQYWKMSFLLNIPIYIHIYIYLSIYIYSYIYIYNVLSPISPVYTLAFMTSPTAPMTGGFCSLPIQTSLALLWPALSWYAGCLARSAGSACRDHWSTGPPAESQRMSTGSSLERFESCPFMTMGEISHILPYSQGWVPKSWIFWGLLAAPWTQKSRKRSAVQCPKFNG